MKTFLDFIESQVPDYQAALLTRFLEDVDSGRATGKVEEIVQLLNQIGSLLPMPDGGYTDPDVFNQAVRTLLANIAGLYGEIDRLDDLQAGLTSLNRAELERVENALREVGSILGATKRVHASRLQYTDIFFETFAGDAQFETAHIWFRPLPLLENLGRVESFLPSYIDPIDRSLTLRPGGNFSRSVTAEGEPLVHVEVSQVLGLSLDRTHGPENTVDGEYGSYWRELILSEAPIQADPFQVPWLPETYTEGAAAQLHYRFPFAVPFTELLIRTFANYPVRCLQVVWDNRKVTQATLVTNGTFTSGSTTGWTVSLPTGGSSTAYAAGGYGGKSYLNLSLTGGSALIQNSSFTSSGARTGCHLHLKARYTNAIRLYAVVDWQVGGSTLRSDRVELQGPRQEWFETSHLFLPPSGWVEGGTGTLTLTAEGSGSASYTDVVFAPVLGWMNTDLLPDPESDNIRIALPGALGTDVWLVLSQLHYEFLQIAVPRGELDQTELWEQVQLDVAGRADSLFGTDESPWSLEGGERRTQAVPLPTQETGLLREVRRLGGRVKNLFSELLRFTHPDPQSTLLNRYLYTLGAWEVQIRHREYAPHGLHVTKPYRPRGEVRELNLLPNPGITQLSGDVRFWITARASDGTDKAKPFDGQALFFSSEEFIPDTAITHFVMTPVTQRETFEGTDRYSRLRLTHHPYVNLERVWRVHASLSSGTLTWPLRFDGNRETYNLYTSGTPWDRVLQNSYTVTQVTGYRPLRVWIELTDGQVARPDTLGRVQVGDVGYSGREILERRNFETEYEKVVGRRRKRAKRSRQGTAERPRRRKSSGVLTQFNFDWSAVARDVSQEELSQLPFVEDAVEDLVETQRGRQRRVRARRVKKIRAELHTRFDHIVSGPNGAALSLYLHKSADVDPSGNYVTSGDILIPHLHYTLDAEAGTILVHTQPPNGDPAYDTFVAYYYFFRGENSREEFDVERTGTVPVSGIDLEGDALQVYPVTRNVTDYVRGETPPMRPYQPDDLLPDYYPVFEYRIDNRGELVFANNFHPFGDIPAKITVEYESLMIEPRLIIEFPKKGANAFSTRTPVIRDFALLCNSRR